MLQLNVNKIVPSQTDCDDRQITNHESLFWFGFPTKSGYSLLVFSLGTLDSFSDKGHSLSSSACSSSSSSSKNSSEWSITGGGRVGRGCSWRVSSWSVYLWANSRSSLWTSMSGKTTSLSLPRYGWSRRSSGDLERERGRLEWYMMKVEQCLLVAAVVMMVLMVCWEKAREEKHRPRRENRTREEKRAAGCRWVARRERGEQMLSPSASPSPSSRPFLSFGELRQWVELERWSLVTLSYESTDAQGFAYKYAHTNSMSWEKILEERETTATPCITWFSHCIQLRMSYAARFFLLWLKGQFHNWPLLLFLSSIAHSGWMKVILSLFHVNQVAQEWKKLLNVNCCYLLQLQSKRRKSYWCWCFAWKIYLKNHCQCLYKCHLLNSWVHLNSH